MSTPSATTSRRWSSTPICSKRCSATPDPDKKAKEIEIKLVAPPAQARGRPAVQGARRAARGAEGAARAGPARQHRVPQGAPRARQGRRRSRERAAEPIEDEDRGKAALTELFEEVRERATRRSSSSASSTTSTRSSAYVRFAGWQNTHAGEREVKMALRKTLFKYKLHQDQELFDRAYGYIRQYY